MFVCIEFGILMIFFLIFDIFNFLLNVVKYFVIDILFVSFFVGDYFFRSVYYNYVIVIFKAF